MDSVAFAAALTELALDTVIILTGTNDQRITGGASTFEANLRSFIARIRATLPGSDILFVMPCENERTDNPVSMVAMAKRAKKWLLNCAFINLQNIFEKIRQIMLMARFTPGLPRMASTRIQQQVVI
jgi:lysophospholipase L1-like esterase